MSSQERRSRVYVFVDGPNYSRGNRDNFQIDLPKLRAVFVERYGNVEEFFWYDLEMEKPICPVLDAIRSEAETGGGNLEQLIVNVLDSNDKVASEVKNELIASYAFPEKREGKDRFLKQTVERFAGGKLIMAKREEHSYPTACPKCYHTFSWTGNIEAGLVDSKIAVDMVYFAGRDMYDAAVLVSGDGRLVQSVSYVRDFGKRVVVATFERLVSLDLRSAADEFLSFNSIRPQVELIRT